MSRHTPGPWTVDETYSEPQDIIAADGFPVAQVDATPILPGFTEKVGVNHWAEAPGRAYIERPSDEVIANARLIAAAPEMLAALRACVACGEMDRQGASANGWNAASLARAAIRKATEG